MGLKGSIGTDQKCPKCGGKFEHVNNDVGLMCKNCLTRPTRYWISAKSMGIPRLKYSSRLGKVFDSWNDVVNEWTAMNAAYNEGQDQKGRPWNPNDWIASQVKLQEFQEKAKTFLDNYQALYDHSKLSRSRFTGITNIVNNFLVPYFKGKDIRHVTKDEVKTFYFHLLDLKDENGEPYGDYHVRDILSCLKSMFFAYRPDTIEFPEHSIVRKNEVQWLGIERQMAIEPHVPNKHKLAIRVLQFTGMRPGELRALQVNDMIDGALKVWKAFSDRGLRLSRKSGGEVLYQLSLDLWEDLREHTKGKNPDDFIFTINGKPYGPNCLYRAWKKACIAAGVKYIPLQQASRHSTASRIMADAKKKALEEIQRQLGHNNKQTAKKHYIIE